MNPHDFLIPKSGWYSLLETNISRLKGTLKDDFRIPQVGYVSSLVGIPYLHIEKPRLAVKIPAEEERKPSTGDVCILASVLAHW